MHTGRRGGAKARSVAKSEDAPLGARRARGEAARPTVRSARARPARARAHARRARRAPPCAATPLFDCVRVFPHGGVQDSPGEAVSQRCPGGAAAARRARGRHAPRRAAQARRARPRRRLQACAAQSAAIVACAPAGRARAARRPWRGRGRRARARRAARPTTSQARGGYARTPSADPLLDTFEVRTGGRLKEAARRLCCYQGCCRRAPCAPAAR